MDRIKKESTKDPEKVGPPISLRPQEDEVRCEVKVTNQSMTHPVIFKNNERLKDGPDEEIKDSGSKGHSTCEGFANSVST